MAGTPPPGAMTSDDILAAGGDTKARSDLLSRVRFDAAQTLTDAQKANARGNLGTIDQGAVYYGFSTAAQQLALTQQTIAKSIAEAQSITRAEFTRGRYRKDNSPATRAQALAASRSGAATWPKLQLPVTTYADGVPRVLPTGQVLERGTTNLLDSPDFAGAVVGVRGAGGALPTGWDGSFVNWEVQSAAVVDGAVRLRLHCSRGVNTASPSIKLCGAVNGKNVSPPVKKGFAFAGYLRINSMSGACTGAFLNMVEMDGSTSTPIGPGQSPVVMTTGAYQAIIGFRPTSGHYISPRLGFLVSDATSAFDIVLDLTLLQCEEADSVTDNTSWTATTRGVEGASLITPTYDAAVDVFSAGDSSGGWTLGLANPGTISLTAPVGSLLLRESVAFPAITIDNWQARATFASGLYPPKLATPPGFPLGVYNGKPMTAILRDGLNFAMITPNGPSFDGNKPWVYQVSNNKFRHDRFELRFGDTGFFDPVSERTMLQSGWYATPILAGQMYQVKGAFMLEPGDPISAVASQFLVLLQLHVKWATQPPGGYSPPCSIGMLPGDYLILDLRTTTQFPIGNGPGDYPVKPGVYWTSKAPIQRGVLHNFVLRVLYDSNPTGAGRVQFWLDGVLVADYSGPVGYAGALGYTLDYGLYRHPAPETVAINFYNMRPPTLVALGAALPAPEEIA